MVLETKIVEDFLSSDEADLVKNHIIKVGSYQEDRHSNYSVATGWSVPNYFWYWDYDNDLVLKSIINDRLNNFLGKKINVVGPHIVQSNVPYYLHNDAYLHWNKDKIPEYTVIISLDNYDAKTIIFNEYTTEFDSENDNSAWEYKKKFLKNSALKIDPYFYKDYLTHIPLNEIKGFSVESVFEWKKGSLLLFDRKKFHCGSNFLSRGLTYKLGIVFWTLSN